MDQVSHMWKLVSRTMLFCGVVVIAWGFYLGVAVILKGILSVGWIYCRFSFLWHSQPNVMYCISSKLLNVAEKLLHWQITFWYINLYPSRFFKISVGRKRISFSSNFITTFRSVKKLLQFSSMWFVAILCENN